MILMIMPAECDISVSKLLCFKTFPFILIESDLKNIGIGKVSVSVSKNFGIDKKVSVSKEIGIGVFCFWPISITFGPQVLNN